MKLILSVAAVVLVGCDGGGSSRPPTVDAVVVDPGLTVDEALAGAIRVTCEKAHSCKAAFPGTPAEFEQTFGTTVPACISSLSGQADLGGLKASVMAGRIIYNAGDAEICLDGLEMVTCPQFWDGTAVEPPECDTAFAGTVANGGNCTINEDCASTNATCDTSTLTCGL